jgi:hypothetical protein
MAKEANVQSFYLQTGYQRLQIGIQMDQDTS